MPRWPACWPRFPRRPADAALSARGRDGFARFKREERNYDALVAHGRLQHVAPGALAGPDTVIRCS